MTIFCDEKRYVDVKRAKPTTRDEL